MDKRVWIVQAVSHSAITTEALTLKVYPLQQGIPSIITGPIMAIISDLYGRRWMYASSPW